MPFSETCYVCSDLSRIRRLDGDPLQIPILSSPVSPHTIDFMRHWLPLRRIHAHSLALYESGLRQLFQGPAKHPLIRPSRVIAAIGKWSRGPAWTHRFRSPGTPVSSTSHHRRGEIKPCGWRHRRARSFSFTPICAPVRRLKGAGIPTTLPTHSQSHRFRFCRKRSLFVKRRPVTAGIKRGTAQQT